MTGKQIEKIRLSIKKHRSTLTAERRKFGGFDDSAGRRYFISDLYLRIADYSGVLTYKKWFDKNFPDDCGTPILSLNWSIAFHSSGLIEKCKIYTLDTAFQNVYLHGLLLDREVKLIDMKDPNGNKLLEHTKSWISDCKKNVTKPYMEWLSAFIDSNEYSGPITKFISLLQLLADETDDNNRIIILNRIRDMEQLNLRPK
jgi:hypothetical protein